MPARNSIKLLTRRQNESHGGPRRPCACCGNWEIRRPVNPADREARALRGPPWFSFCLRVKSFLCCRRARQCQVPIGCRSQRRHSRISTFPVRHACFISISLRRICRPRSTLSPIYAASPQRTAPPSRPGHKSTGPGSARQNKTPCAASAVRRPRFAASGSPPGEQPLPSGRHATAAVVPLRPPSHPKQHNLRPHETR